MKCPYCLYSITEVTNSRPTRVDAQIWRRRQCLKCKAIFTTHEIIDLSHLVVIKKNGNSEMFSRIKLYSGIYGATLGSKTANREKVVDRVTREVERDLLGLKKKKLNSWEIADIVLFNLRKFNTATFLRYLAYCKDIATESQLNKELEKYLH